MTEGHGLADAIHMARDYIGCYCYDIENADIPASSSINDIDVSKGMFYEDGVSDITLVDVDIDSYRKKMENTVNAEYNEKIAAKKTEQKQIVK